MVFVALLAMCLVAHRVSAHCDSLDGPVVADARVALAQGDPGPVLKWVGKEREEEIRVAFKETMAVRAQGGEAESLADRHFFETVVRIHRAGEGEGFTGLKPAGGVDPGLSAADMALRSGSAKQLAERMSAAISEGIQTRFAIALERKAHAAASIDAGRAYVAAYVDYIHFVEGAYRLASDGASHRHHESPPNAVVPEHVDQ